MADKVECPECGDEYRNLGQHWWGSPSHRLELTNYQKEVITGLMMGDGSLNRQQGENPRLDVGMITKEYLEELDEIFGCLSTGVKLQRTAEEIAENSRQTGFDSNAKAENYHDYWYLNTRRLPELTEFDWYTGKNGGKVWPDNIQLTPTVLTHWYAGDGNWDNNGYNNYIRIAASNEIDNTDKIDSYFESVSLPTPSNYNKSEIGMNIQFTVDQSKELWEYMESPPSGFKYKFPEEYR